jgi:hypothetical protein
MRSQNVSFRETWRVLNITRDFQTLSCSFANRSHEVQLRIVTLPKVLTVQYKRAENIRISSSTCTTQGMFCNQNALGRGVAVNVGLCIRSSCLYLVTLLQLDNAPTDESFRPVTIRCDSECKFRHGCRTTARMSGPKIFCWL